MNFKNILNALILFLLLACTSPIEKLYNENSLKTDLHEIIETNTLDTSETTQLSLYLSIHDTKHLFEGKTYAELWEETKRFQIERERQQHDKNLIQIAQAEKETKLQESITLSLQSKVTQKMDNQELLIYSFYAANKTSKDIRAFKGTVIFKDLFDDEISTITLSNKETIKAGDSAVCMFQSPYNSFMQSDKKLKEIDLDNLHIEWSPLKIIFTDNSTL